MPLVVVVDADVLFGSTTRALFIYLNYTGELHVHWTQRILTEMSTALVKAKRKPDIDAARANEARMNASLAQAMVVEGYVEARMEQVRERVNDPNDAHVAACALELLEGGYYPDIALVYLVSRNLDDYKVAELGTMGIEVQHPDEFLQSLELETVASAFRAMRLDIPGADIGRLLTGLNKDGQVKTAKLLHDGWNARRFEL
jgi:hypothetical protein